MTLILPVSFPIIFHVNVWCKVIEMQLMIEKTAMEQECQRILLGDADYIQLRGQRTQTREGVRRLRNSLKMTDVSACHCRRF